MKLQLKKLNLINGGAKFSRPNGKLILLPFPTTPSPPYFSRDSADLSCRAHRQRTLDYIDELESEIFRLRSSTTTTSGEITHPGRGTPSQNALKIINNININVLIQSFNGQIAPGIFASIFPGATDPCIMEGVLANDVFSAYLHSCLSISHMPHFI